MYSLYTYKQGFGGFSLFTLETHDQVYQPANDAALQAQRASHKDAANVSDAANAATNA
jgi:hypothetical protein